MKNKLKKQIVIPVAILIYTFAIAIYAAKKYYTPENRRAYFFVIGVNVVLAVVLYFILKRRESFREKNKK
ncbi:MAG: hypothetical protein PHO84_04845 [Dysgonamonadaceae bacterium]|jgi:nitrogen fixation/metabolism regulation signal transduction histidine kinase|nr:hypothetical protein [Dysgonamonadaceae bacterium]MDD3727582.1 hypothetical protein [Dysgonamonadaceae bacterium]MDD4246464.1 hypothetical protein [Dysgonamonadaceae bacterium]